ncbi:MAG TPA: DNA mismatch repair endonuclease MutL [Blastocatellia bacterium]|nr:DNA mismatch repair endonuclease MutL [Blastocatellia bacterium]
MSKIKVLPDTLANKIAAGEVVERPASVVKELLENALDAGASRINVEVEVGGKRLIRLLDDGEGMTRDEAIIAFERHATSKLRTADDLEAITTLGFRGEALPSIASVSRLFLRTKTSRDAEGTEVEFNGGKLVAVRDIAWPGGSEVEVRELFFNIPARRKFLKSDATESFHITNLVQHYALANPQLSFLLVGNGRDVIRVSTVKSLKERAYQVLGGSLLDKLVEVRSEMNGLKVSGFVSNPQEQRSSRDAQYLFINRRFVRDQLIGRALSEAYRSMMPSGTYPAAVLFIDVPPTEVDVNVHPAKTEVRFLHEGAILAFVRDAVTDALRSTRPVTTVPGIARGSDQRSDVPVEWASWGDEEAHPAIETRGIEDIPSPVKAYQTTTPLAAESDVMAELSRDELEIRVHTAVPVVSRESVIEVIEANELIDQSADLSRSEDSMSLPVTSTTDSSKLPGFGHGIKPLGQIRDSYIVATDDEGLLLVDQHVAHERVLFEQFRDERLARSAGLQPLLIPATLDLNPSEAEAFSIVEDELAKMGIETIRLSGRTIAITTAPAGLASSDVLAVVREVFTVVERERRNSTVERIRDGIAAELACKAAIKVNMPLTSEKMQWLIDELMKTNNPMTCPHGRPIMMRMGLRDIERGFKRPV